MSWTPEPRPDWVTAVNQGGILPIDAIASLPFERDGLLGEAAARQALDDFGGDDFLEPLDIICRALEEEARLTVLGRSIARQFILRLLQVRLQLIAAVTADPGIADETIAGPIIVVGAPRTGTTLLHTLLAENISLRAPRGWELLHPAPPPQPDHAADDPRIAVADVELGMLQAITSRLASIHPYGGTMLKECLSAMSFSFRSEEFVSRYHVPSYVAWLQQADMGPAYAMHRLVLQTLQRRWPTRRWVLKSPVHLQSLSVLKQTYPDAALVATHRDPLAILGSVSSLIATLRYAQSDAVDMAEIGRYHADLYHRSLTALVDDDHGAMHLRYADLVADPVRTVGRLFGDLGESVTAETEAAMRAHLSERPTGGEHDYAFADLGIDEAETRQRFAPYVEAYLS